jgi:endogenous inhibitor of DNA gyrase (YacG/DUF329 family)
MSLNRQERERLADRFVEAGAAETLANRICKAADRCWGWISLCFVLYASVNNFIVPTRYAFAHPVIFYMVTKGHFSVEDLLEPTMSVSELRDAIYNLTNEQVRCVIRIIREQFSDMLHESASMQMDQASATTSRGRRRYPKASTKMVRQRISEKTMLQERCAGCGKDRIWSPSSERKEGGYWTRCREIDCQAGLKILQPQYERDVTTLHGLQDVSCPKCGAKKGFWQDSETAPPHIYEDIPLVLHVVCKAKQCLCLAFNGSAYARGDFTRTADQTCFGKASNLDVVKVKFHNNSGKGQHKVKLD